VSPDASDEVDHPRIRFFGLLGFVNVNEITILLLFAPRTTGSVYTLTN